MLEINYFPSVLQNVVPVRYRLLSSKPVLRTRLRKIEVKFLPRWSRRCWLRSLTKKKKKKKKNDSRIIIMRHIEIDENVCGYTRAGGKNRSLTGRSIERGRIRFGSPEGNQRRHDKGIWSQCFLSNVSTFIEPGDRGGGRDSVRWHIAELLIDIDLAIRRKLKLNLKIIDRRLLRLIIIALH